MGATTDTIFDVIFADTLTVGMSVGVEPAITAEGTIGETPGGKDFKMGSIGVGIIGEPIIELHAVPSTWAYDTKIYLLTYHGKFIPKNVSIDYFEQEGCEIQKKLAESLGIEGPTNPKSGSFTFVDGKKQTT